MPPVVQNIREETLSPEERHALQILRHLPVEKLNEIKGWLKLGTPGVIGPQTLTEFHKLCVSTGYDLSDSGVNSFKEKHRLGNTGNQRGIIGPQTAGVYFDDLSNKVQGGVPVNVGPTRTPDTPTPPQRDPDDTPEALEKMLLAITGTFEGKGFSNLTGNLDGQGMSFGILQWNFGQRTLAPVLKKMNERDPFQFRVIFGADTDRFLAVLNSDHESQMAFAKSINDSRNRIMEPWKNRFRKLGEHPTFQSVQIEFARPLIAKAKKLCADYELKSQRALSMMFDVVVQNGSIKSTTRQLILQEKEKKERALRRPLTEKEYLEIIATQRADAANPRFRNDVLSRKLCIVRGNGTVHGETLDLDKQFGLNDREFTT